MSEPLSGRIIFRSGRGGGQDAIIRVLRGILPESKYHAMHGPSKYAYERHPPPPPDVSDFEGILVRFGIRVRYTGLSSSCDVRTAGPKKLKMLQLFVIGS